MSEIEISKDFENIALAMLETRGNLAKASRLDYVDLNAMSLRNVVKANPEIRRRYHELLASELEEKGLHIAERILKMAELQEDAFGGDVVDMNGDTISVPTDVHTVIKLSQEISRLITEGKQQSMSSKTTLMLVSKESAPELLERFLNS